MKSSFDALVLDAENRQSLVTVRSLGKRGLTVVALANKDRKAPAFSSRWCSKTIVSPAAEGTEEYATFILDFVSRNHVNAIIPSSDSTIDILNRHRDAISRHTHIAIASREAFDRANNKIKTLETARGLGILIPRGVSVTSSGDVDRAIEELGLPVIVKPVESWIKGPAGMKRVCPLLAATREEAHRMVNDLLQYGGQAIFQEYLTGAREAVSLIFARNTVYARFAQLATRTQPPIGGTSVVRRSIEIPQDIGIQAEHLVRALDLEGYSEVEFRRDARGVPYLMEINPRLSASVEIAVRSGVDFPYLIYQWAARKPITIANRFRTGIWERDLAGDIINLAQTINERGRPGIPSPLIAIALFIFSFFSPMYYDYVDLQDLRPAVDATIGFLLQSFSNLISMNINL